MPNIALLNKNETIMSEAGILFKRYVWLIDTVKSGRWTKEDIMGKWERCYHLNDECQPMADKTFHNHINAIKNIFGLQIKCRKYGDKTYYIENLSENDEYSDIKEWLIETLSVSNIVNECSSLRGRIQFERIPSGQLWLTTIIKAMQENHPLDMTYKGFWGRGEHTFRVEPYFVKVFKQRWYLIAHSVGDNQVRCYALDRIYGLDVVVDKSFAMPSTFHPDEFFEDCYGVIHGDNEKTQTVRIKVTGRQAKYVESLPLHTSQIAEEGGNDDCKIFRYRIKPTFDFIQEIFSHADSFEVLEPPTLRNQIAGMVHKMAECYSTQEDAL